MIAHNPRELVTVEIRRASSTTLSATLAPIPAAPVWEPQQAIVYRRSNRAEIRQVNDAGATFDDDNIVVSFRNPSLQVLEGEQLRLPDGRILTIQGPVRRYKRSVQCECQLLKPQTAAPVGKP